MVKSMNVFARLSQKYKKIPIPVKASFWFFAMNIIQKGVIFIVTPIYTKLVSTEEYGYYSTYISYYNIVIVIATLGLYNGVVNNGLLRYETEDKKFISAIQSLGNVATLSTFLVVFLFGRFVISFTGLDIWILLGMFMNMLVYPAFLYWSMYQKYKYKYRLLCISTIVLAILTPSLSIILLKFWSCTGKSIILGTIISQVIIGFIFYVYNFVQGGIGISIEKWKYAFGFNIPLVPHYLSTIVLGQSDRIMINKMVGNSKVAIYSISYTVSQIMLILFNSINAVYTPWTYKRIKASNIEIVRKTSKTILLFLGLLTALFVLIAPEIVLFMGGKVYLEAKWIIAPVVLGVFYTFVFSFYLIIEFYYEKTRYVMMASNLAALLNIGLNYYCIERFGYMAAGYTTMLCYGVLMIFHERISQSIIKKESIGQIFDVGFVRVYVLIITVLCFLAMLTYRFTTIRYIMFGCCSIIITMAIYVHRRSIMQISKQEDI